jgi:carbonic anhydrase
MLSADQALQRLRDGNRRFAEGLMQGGRAPVHDLRSELLEGQAPFAIILGCSDSRVPAEIIFDQCLGDLFVIRVAGNVVAPSQVGSVEFAAETFGTRLVVVLGHSMCGAVLATLESLDNPSGSPSPNLDAIIGRIRPVVESLPPGDGDRLQRAIRANIRASAAQLRRGSPALDRLIRAQGLKVVAAEYSLESGRVDFFDGDSC